MNNSFLIAPSILSADFSKLGEEINNVTRHGADWIHIDVMDGHFVPNITIGPSVVKSIRSISNIFFDVHLMIESPEKFIDDFVHAGANLLTFHIETTQDPETLIKKIKEKKIKVGITLKPQTPIETIVPYISQVDLVLIMTVNPGFSGQNFLNDQIDKIKWVRNYITKNKLSTLIQVDGGINDQTAKFCFEADILVAGNYIFKNNISNSIKTLKGIKK